MLARALRFARDAVSVRRDPVSFARKLGVNVGKDCRLISIDRSTFGSEPYLVSIGDHVTITAGVRFITHDGGVWVFRNRYPDLDIFGRVEVGNNVFVGIGAMFMPGVSVGDNCVIGAGAVVTRDVPSNSVAAGVPARVLRSLNDYEAHALHMGVHFRSMDPVAKKAAIQSQFNQRATTES